MQTAERTKELAANTLDELHNQGEKLDSIDRDLHDVSPCDMPCPSVLLFMGRHDHGPVHACMVLLRTTACKLPGSSPLGLSAASRLLVEVGFGLGTMHVPAALTDVRTAAGVSHRQG